jgi:hypothetical protein
VAGGANDKLWPARPNVNATWRIVAGAWPKMRRTMWPKAYRGQGGRFQGKLAACGQDAAADKTNDEADEVAKMSNRGRKGLWCLVGSNADD